MTTTNEDERKPPPPASTNYYYKKLNGLLAIIHRDGGHYTQEFGIYKSLTDAHEIIARLFSLEDS